MQFNKQGNIFMFDGTFEKKTWKHKIKFKEEFG